MAALLASLGSVGGASATASQAVPERAAAAPSRPPDAAARRRDCERRAAEQADRIEAPDPAHGGQRPDATLTRRLAASLADLRRCQQAARATAVEQAKAKAPQQTAPAIPARIARPAGSVAPVAGPILQRYGQATDAGAASGVTYAPAPSAPVRAPCRGRIEFSGPFRSYGKMVIVDCGRSTRFVLAGLDRVDVMPGADVWAGEPLGRMARFDPAMHDRPTLYVQERRGSQTIDPSASPEAPPPSRRKAGSRRQAHG